MPLSPYEWYLVELPFAGYWSDLSLDYWDWIGLGILYLFIMAKLIYELNVRLEQRGLGIKVRKILYQTIGIYNIFVLIFFLMQK